MTFPACTCGGELAPPIVAVFVGYVDRENAADHWTENEYAPRSDVTEAEEEEANRSAALAACASSCTPTPAPTDTANAPRPINPFLQ